MNFLDDFVCEVTCEEYYNDAEWSNGNSLPS